MNVIKLNEKQTAHRSVAACGVTAGCSTCSTVLSFDLEDLDMESLDILDEKVVLCRKCQITASEIEGALQQSERISLPTIRAVRAECEKIFGAYLSAEGDDISWDLYLGKGNVRTIYKGLMASKKL